MARDVRGTDAARLARAAHVIVVAGTLVLTLLAGARARADRPWVDEGWFASPAVNLIRAGHMGTTILDPNHFQLTGLAQYTYWIMPLYPLSLATWFSAAGVSVMTMRAFSVLWCVLGFLALLAIARAAGGGNLAAAAAALLLGVDFVLVRAGAVGRMDMMAAALGFLAIAIYLHGRDRHLVRAVALASTAAALSWMTHPTGGVHLIGLCVTILWLDARRLSPALVVGLVLPNVLAAAAWGAYIAIQPDMFVAQFSRNVGRRFSLLSQPLLALSGEWQRYFGGAPGSLAGLLKTALVVPYGAGVALFAFSRDFRRTFGAPVLFLLALSAAAGVVLLDSRKIYLYALHVTPYFVTLTALACYHLFDRRGVRTWMLSVVVTGFALLQGAGTAYTIVRNGYAREFVPVAQAIAPATATGQFVIGSAELAFAGGFDGRVLDDVTLGYHIHRTPDVVVLDERYREYVAVASKGTSDESAHVRAVLEQLSEREVLGPYEVRRRPGGRR